MHKLRVGKILVSIAAMTLLLQGCSVMPEEEELLAPPVKEPEAVEYTTQKVERGDIVNTAKGSGNIGSKKQYSLSFPYRSGYLKSVNVKLGDTVKKGQLIAELDTDSLEKDIQKKQLEIEKIKLELEQLKKNNSSNELERKKLRLQYLEDRKKQFPDEALDLEYQIEDLKLEIKDLENQDGESYDIRAKKKDLEIAQIDLDDLKLTRDKSQIVAPSSGKVTYVEEIGIGDYVPALKTIIKLSDPSDLILEYTGGYALDMKVGMPVTITVGGTTVTGEVATTPSDFPAEEQELRKETVFIKMDEVPDGIEIGDSASFEVILEQKEDVLIVPKRAVIQYMGTFTARVLSEDNIRSERDIEVGIETATQYEVVSGLEEGDIVILE
ncbi:efflux RND transporter periplasmic adaptor subunit [Massiliimalia massiliensis]|jgi:macrolide-specific efflux system membrane fusion protein|uniref:efflux RND transporter periplasmic adaptor subunit n=1 Tax=Massiliimalia massiliensis TaxID=1852384 RepID=UPI0013562CF5|nr:biotin/lipoyl-binding protein [Massiliimalia massiliensis]